MFNFKEFVLQYFRVATFKTPPQDLPASDSALYLTITFSLLVGLLRYVVVGAEYYSLVRVVLDLAVPATLVYLLLTFFKLPGRFKQTFAAVAGSGAIIYAIAIPVLPSFFASVDSSQSKLPVYIIIAIDLWSVAVLAYIIKHAVNVGIATGISLAVALVLLTLILVEGISPTRNPASNPDSESANKSASESAPSLFEGESISRLNWHSDFPVVL